MKTHLATGPDQRGIDQRSACGRGTRLTDNPFNVTCLLCGDTPDYQVAKDEADRLRRVAFFAQTPRQYNEPWWTVPTPIVCKECSNDTFRIGDRTCYGHYQNFVCASCGHAESRLTETGMSF